MFNKSGFIAKQSTDSSTLKGLLANLLLKAYADEGDDGGAGGEGDSGVNSPQINFETLIANARKEEKEKLYPRIKKLEDENKALVQNNNDNLVRIAQLQSEIEGYRANDGESQKVKDLEAQLESAQAEVKTLRESTPNEDEIRARIEAEYEVKMYRTTKLSENSDRILAVFADEVQGSSIEEIDASFEMAVEKTVQTKKQLGLLDENGNPIETSPKNDPKKTTTKKETTPPVANPGTENEDKFDFDYVQNLDPRSKEYAEFRKKMGLK